MHGGRIRQVAKRAPQAHHRTSQVSTAVTRWRRVSWAHRRTPQAFAMLKGSVIIAIFVALNIDYVFNSLWRLSACLDHKIKSTRLYGALKFRISSGNLDKTDTECRSQRLHVYFSGSMKIVSGECTA